MWNTLALRQGARSASAAAALLLSTCVANRAEAQTCHLGLTPESAPGFAAVSRVEAASYENQRYSGHYEGAFIGASFRTPGAGLAVVLPAYHLVRNGLDSVGLGDVALEARLIPFRRRVSVGAVLAGTLPTGSVEDELGMGHPMVSLAALVATQLDVVGIEAVLGYARALDGDSAAHHHHSLGSSPLVAPMNPAEFEGFLTATARASRRVSTRLGLSVALPVGGESGSARGASVFGVELREGRMRLGLEGALPFLGDAFRAKGAVELGVRF